MEYIILAFAIYSIILNCMAITMVRTFKPHQGANRGHNVAVTIAENTHCRACNALMVEHNHGCKPEDLKQAIRAETQADISATIADVENYLLADYERYRDTLLELKALPPGITHTDGDTDNNAVENLKLKEREPVDYELATSGLDAGRPYKWDDTLSWEANIKAWEARAPIEYPEGYEQGIVIFQDNKPIYKSTDINGKGKFKTLIKFDKVKKVRKSKIKAGVC